MIVAAGSMCDISDFLKSKSSGISEDRNSVSFLISGKCGAMTDELIRWIEAGLAHSGKSKMALATRLGKSPSTVTAILSGHRQIKVEEIPIIADFFDFPPPAVYGRDLTMRAEVTQASEGRLSQVTVAGPAEAGAFRLIDDQDQSEPDVFFEPLDADFPRARRMAFDVYGDSMNRLEPYPIMPGSRIIGVDFNDAGVPLRDRMVVVVERERDGGQMREWSVKQVELHDDRIEFHPRSSNSRHKPIVVARDLNADDGEIVSVLALLREIKHKVPTF